MRLLCILVILAVSRAVVNYKGYKVFRVAPTDTTQEWLEQLATDSYYDIWMEGGPSRPSDVMVHPDRLTEMVTSLDAMGAEYEVTIDDVQEHLDDAKLSRSFKKPESNFTDYMTYTEMENWLNYAVNYCGSRCQLINVGQSYEGRDIYVFKISTGAGKQGLWVDGGIHAREWIAHHTALYILDRFVFTFGLDPEVAAILDVYDVYILPVVNPDGYVYTWTDDRLWRKTRNPHDGDNANPCVGADCNRNYDFMWMTVGASDDPCNDTFAGPEPHSEPESAIQRDYMFQFTGNWQSFISLHTYAQAWMAPWGYTFDPPPNYDELMRVANIGASALEAVHGTQLAVGSSSDILYQSSGTSRDWAAGHAQTMIPYAYTLELRNGNSSVLPPSEIIPTGEETWAGYKAHVFAIINGP